MVATKSAWSVRRCVHAVADTPPALGTTFPAEHASAPGKNILHPVDTSNGTTWGMQRAGRVWASTRLVTGKHTTCNEQAHGLEHGLELVEHKGLGEPSYKSFN